MGDFTKRLQKRVMTKGPEEGFCVICGTHGKLTRDHVPPAGCNNGVDVVLRMFPQEYGGDSSGRRTFSQGGTHFKTLCERCNSHTLGTKYDPELVKLSDEVTRVALAANSGQIVLPRKFVTVIKPQKIAKSVVGHILAANAIEEARSGTLSAPFPDALRRYFLDESEPLPNEVNIYIWIYPSRRQVVVKNSAKISMSRNGTMFGHIFKFLPLGFWVLWNKPEGLVVHLPALGPDKKMGVHQMHQMEIDLSIVPKLDFPEAPGDDEAILFRDDATSVGLPKDGI